jgi:hypothetical protein
LAILSPQAISTNVSISAKLVTLDADEDSFPTAKVYAVRPVAWIRRRVRESRDRKEYELEVVPIKMPMVVASLAFWMRKYLRRRVRERNVDRVVGLDGDRDEFKMSVLRQWSSGE